MSALLSRISAIPTSLSASTSFTTDRPMVTHFLRLPVEPPPPVTGGPTVGSTSLPRPARPDSRGPLPDVTCGSTRELLALLTNPSGGSPPPFHAHPSVQLDEGSVRRSSTRLPQMALPRPRP
ncbi:hypothetical protein FRC11_004250 [Ceratobasidium sp. 423]|nr:hypothetical protein FRC11_004250 [Ceratobasidium sp. 423]